MEITIKGTMPNGAKIQIEDWSKDLPHLLNTKYIIGAYPISKRSLQGQFAAKEGKTFRAAFNFSNKEDAEKAYNKLINGETALTDYYANFNGNNKEFSCI
ncbi:hypothetical protein [Oceanobacillus sp. FSL H7-0719]|uniref:hypothetical protein n=1 Tax=Oceanobacillus sp. FSL H7-0719 TaxID=2954507 RepID=UPI0032514333